MEEKEFLVRGVAHDLNVAKVAILGVPDKPGVAFQVFSALANSHIDVDMIVQSIRNTDQKITDIVFTIAKSEAKKAKKIIENFKDQLGILGVTVDENVAKVSVVGAGMLGNPGIAATMFGALGNAGVNIEVISTSEISISCLIQADKVKEAVNAIHDSFFKDDFYDVI